jgi:hypothetical protein
MTRSSIADDLPPGDAFEFRPEVDAPLETPGRRMRPSPRATATSPASGARRPSSSVLQETPSPAKRARGAAASPAKVLQPSASEFDFQDFKQKCVRLPRFGWLFLRNVVCRLARQFQAQRVEKLIFEDIFQSFQGRYSEQEVRVSLAKMVCLQYTSSTMMLNRSHAYPQCAEGILFEEQGEDGSMLFHIL